MERIQGQFRDDFIGASAEPKPVAGTPGLKPGSKFYETDTSSVHLWSGNGWAPFKWPVSTT